MRECLLSILRRVRRDPDCSERGGRPGLWSTDLDSVQPSHHLKIKRTMVLPAGSCCSLLYFSFSLIFSSFPCSPKLPYVFCRERGWEGLFVLPTRGCWWAEFSPTGPCCPLLFPKPPFTFFAKRGWELFVYRGKKLGGCFNFSSGCVR